MTDRTAMGAGCVYSAVFPLIFYALYATYYMRLKADAPHIALPVFCLAMVLIYLCSALTLRRGAAVPALAGLNVLTVGAALAAVLMLSRFSAMGQIVFAGFMVVGCAVIAVCTGFYPVTVPRLLTQCDVAAVACAWMCMLQAGGAIPSGVLLYYPAALLLILAALLALRTFGSGEQVVYGSRLWGGLLSAGLLGIIGGALYLFIRFLSGTSRTVLSALIHGVTSGAAWLWALIDRFMTWLAGLWTVDDWAAAPPTEQTGSLTSGAEEITDAALDPRILMALGIALAAAAAVFLLVVVIRMRRVKLRLPDAQRTRTQARSGKRAGALAKRWRAFWFKIRFQIVFFLRKNTATGLLVWLERWGARHNAPRKPGETHRAYLARLSAREELAQGSIPAQLSELSDLLDRRYFGGQAEGALPFRGGRVRGAFRGVKGKTGQDDSQKGGDGNG